MAYQSELEKLTRQYDDKPEQYFAPLAEAFRKAGELEHAIEVLRTGLELRPNYLSAHIVLGRCHLDQQNDAEAARVFEHVLTLDAENIIALKALGEIAVRADDPSLARRWLTRLLEVDPMNQEAQEALDALGPAPDAPPSADAEETPPLTDEQHAAVAAKGVEQVADFEPTSLDAGEPPEPPAAEEGLELERVEPAFDADAPTLHMDSYEPDAPAAQPDEAGVPSEAPESPTEADAPGTAPTEPTEAIAAEVSQDERVSTTREIPADSTALRAVEVEVGDADAQSGELTLEGPAPDITFDEPPAEATPAAEAPAPEGDDAPSEVDATPEVAATVEEQVVRPEALVQPEPAPVADAEPVQADEPAEPAESADAGALATPEIAEVTGPASSEDVESVAEPEAGAVPEQSPEPEAEPVPAAEGTAAPDALPFILPEDVTPPGTETAAEPEPVITETMAEVYAKQGLVAEARDVYRKLLAERPGDPALEARLAELVEREPPAFGAAARTEDSARDFLMAILSARLPDVAGGSEPVEPNADSAPVNSMDAVPTEASVVPEAAPSPEPTGTQGSEERTPLETAFEDTAEPRGAPTAPASDEVSLASVFGEEPAQKPSADSEPSAGEGAPQAGAGFSFDEFFGTKKPPSQKAESPRPRRSSQLDAADEDEFRTWLKGLKS